MATESPGRAAIYTRISEDREGLARGVERQEEDCRARATMLGLTVVDVFTDNDISASTRSRKRRPQYEAMIERARAGEFDTILAYSNSRLTRRPMEFEELIKLSEQHGVRIRTVVSGDDDLATADGQFVARVKAAADAAEAARVAERVKRRVDQRKASGEYHGSSAPFGYRLVPKSQRKNHDLEPDAREVELIREAVTRLLDANDSLYAIVRDWNRLGKLPRTGKVWRQGVLRKALTNPALIARTRPIVPAGQRAPLASEGYPARWEPILDEATYRALCDRLVDRSRLATNPEGVRTSKYALGGLVVCGRCGKGLTVVSRRDQRTKLMCRAVKNDDHPNHPIDPETGRSTGRVTVRYDLLEEYVFEQFIEHLNDMPYWQEHKHDPDPQANAKIADLERLRDAEEAKIRRAEDQAFDGLIDPSRLRELVEGARQKIRELEAQIADLKGRPSVRDNVLTHFGTPEWILAQRDRFPSDVKRTLLKLMIDRIVVNDWPADLQKTASVRGGETLEQFEQRKLHLQREGLRRRVVIDWRG